MSMSRPMSATDTSASAVDWWPAAVVAFGFFLTFVWTIFLIGFPLYLMDVI